MDEFRVHEPRRFAGRERTLLECLQVFREHGVEVRFHVRFDRMDVTVRVVDEIGGFKLGLEGGISIPDTDMAAVAFGADRLAVKYFEQLFRDLRRASGAVG